MNEDHLGTGSDSLDLAPYARALADVIESCETPMTIGIQGEWGVGKTTLMNMLSGTHVGSSPLLDSAKSRVVTLDTWPYARFAGGSDQLVDSIRALVRKSAAVLLEAGADEGEMSKALAAALGHLEVMRHRADRKAPEPAGPVPDTVLAEDICVLLDAFRTSFQAIVSAWTGSDVQRRLVVFIDDLDRIEPVEAVRMLESIRHFTDVPGCVFVIALDYEVIRQGLAAQTSGADGQVNGKAFYDRYVQLPFVMPTEAYPIGRYVTGLLQGIDYPYADELTSDAEARAFYHDITVCTVRRNPRNIKRAVNAARLMERIRFLKTGQPLSRRDARVLYALTCMQVAWPELFSHFVADPTVDTVTSLQNWAYLEQLPRARRLFGQGVDPERVHIGISTFFDTLFRLLDDNDDGQIDTAELRPVLELMHMAPRDVEPERERPRDWFVRRVRENNVDGDTLVETFLERVFTRSVWYLGSECRYLRSGARFVTLTHDGRQIASLVSLRGQPFIFRLAMAPEKVKAGLKSYWQSKKAMKEDAITLTRSAFGKEASMTGFGDTFVDYSKMTHMRSAEAIGLLNALFRVAIGDSPAQWELESNGKK
ncbi:hypothetical protein F3N42_08885 [Marinihelvus fidelis]|uniref:EF-hand domain-containing protein n=1 Tax=Marinihelvus fidelis TaxID=2613842 RepID=A0A5N0TAH0_9GAMM|nr:P-loop NTPase fold protein [Marinihelvus fidelis]KAA9131424.1 hypothetical protein F3N42_08885 [Marinihelvus fidelis]